MSRVLVIDDDPLFRTLVRGTLKSQYVVDVAGDGHEGYQVAIGTKPTVVILDLLMPTWDGVQTLRAFRADATLADVPVLVLTSSMDSSELTEARQLGVQGVIAKCDFRKDALVEVVARLVREAETPKPHLQAKTPPSAIPVSAQHFNG